MPAGALQQQLLTGAAAGFVLPAVLLSRDDVREGSVGTDVAHRVLVGSSWWTQVHFVLED